MKSPEKTNWYDVHDTAQIAYQELIAENHWLTKKKKGSSFASQSDTSEKEKSNKNGNKSGNGS